MMMYPAKRLVFNFFATTFLLTVVISAIIKMLPTFHPIHSPPDASFKENSLQRLLAKIPSGCSNSHVNEREISVILVETMRRGAKIDSMMYENIFLIAKGVKGMKPPILQILHE